MNRISGVMKLHFQEKWSWVYVPAIILFSSFFISFLFSFLITGQEMFYTGGVTSIFIYMFVLGIIIIAQTFPFAIGLSVRRTDYFTGTVVMGIITSSLMGILLCTFAFIEKQTNGWGGRFHFFHFPYLNDGTFLEQIGMYIILFIYLFFSGFVISSFARRFGGKGMLISSLSFLLFTSIAVFLLHHFEAWQNIFQWFTSQTAVQLSYWLLPFILFYLLASYLLLRRASV